MMKYLDKTSNILITIEQIKEGLDKSLLNEEYGND